MSVLAFIYDNFQQLFSKAALCLTIMEVLCDLMDQYDRAYIPHPTALWHRKAEIGILRRGKNCLSICTEEK